MFVDTAGWAAAFVAGERHHGRAVELTRPFVTGRRKVLTTSYVLSELTALLASPLRVPKPRRVEICAAIRTAPWVEVVHIDPTLDAAAWQLWAQRPDKDWSLVDCASFVVMQRRGLADALTADHHFTQAGFTRLLV